MADPPNRLMPWRLRDLVVPFNPAFAGDGGGGGRFNRHIAAKVRQPEQNAWHGLRKSLKLCHNTNVKSAQLQDFKML